MLKCYLETLCTARFAGDKSEGGEIDGESDGGDTQRETETETDGGGKWGRGTETLRVSYCLAERTCAFVKGFCDGGRL